jgi:hypothetical protein
VRHQNRGHRKNIFEVALELEHVAQIVGARKTEASVNLGGRRHQPAAVGRAGTVLADIIESGLCR